MKLLIEKISDTELVYETQGSGKEIVEAVASTIEQNEKFMLILIAAMELVAAKRNNPFPDINPN